MQDDYSYQTSPSTSVQSDWKVDDVIYSEDEDNVSEPSATELKLRSVMSQRDMETLTSWFPKSAQALACVLRTRAQRLGD
jgi:hypothetical protein